jgi:hypothetical protein
MGRLQFNLWRVAQAVGGLAIALVGIRTMLEPIGLAAWFAAAFVACAALGAGIGVLFGRPVMGAILGVALIPPAYILLALISITSGLARIDL